MNENRKALITIVFISIIGFFLIQLNKDSNKRANSSFNITENEIMNHIRFLSSENKKGRYPGSRESKDIISYLIKEFKSYGVKPIIENASFVQPFEIKSDIELGKLNYMIVNDDSLKIREDYIPLWFSGNRTVSGSCVFAGYGMEINEESIQWNDYNNIDVNNKWVIVFRKSPEPENVHSPFTKYSSFHKKMLLARDKGAIGIIYISQIDDTELFPLEYASGYTNDGIPAIHISNKTANTIFKPLGWTQEKIQETISRSMETINFEIPNKKIRASVKLNIKKDRAANVVGVIKSGNRKYRDEYIAIGAHFDHLGQGGKGSGSRQQDLLEVHPGADDNASGVSGLLEVAQKIASQKSKLKRSILLIGFDAEEMGLLGSKRFIENSPIPIENIVTMINLDMIGRMKESTFTVGGVGTSPNFLNILDSLSHGRDIKLKTTSPGFGPSDHASFYTKDIPVLFFFTGLHTDYHTPKDTWKLINVKGEKKILDFLHDFVIHLSKQSKRPRFTEAGPKTGQMSRNVQFKITLGVLPSYGSTKIGLEIDGISKKNGPAANAGIKKGDVIKSIDGKTIKDIYEYMDRLSKLEIGTTVPITIERGGKILTLSISF
mgnify:FL=1